MDYGNQLPDNAGLFMSCGTPIGAAGAAVSEQAENWPAEIVQTKVLSYGGFTGNRNAIQQVNDWRITIDESYVRRLFSRITIYDDKVVFPCMGGKDVPIKE